MKNLYLLVIIVAACSSCASTELVHISVIEPAPVTLPAHIKQVAVINRSETDPRNKVVEVADKIFSLEGAALDKEGAKSSMEGLTNTLLKNDRFTNVIPVPSADVHNAAPGIFPSPLSWQEVEQLCKKKQCRCTFCT